MLALARQSIEQGLSGKELHIRAGDYSPVLQQERATFVTLRVNGELHGCIGTLEAELPLVSDVVKNAHAAAFRDPRFSALTRADFERIDVHISILGPPVPIHCTSEDDLIKQLRPGIDGLILMEGRLRGTFLPAVWDTLPDAREFLRHLKHKADLPADYWSDTIKFERYTTESFY